MEAAQSRQTLNIPHWVRVRLRLGPARCGRTWQASLPNGRPVLAFRLPEEPVLELGAGSEVWAQMSVADFSQAHVLERVEKEE
jgi:hypothetical protein